MYGCRYSTILLSHEYAAFLKLPEVQFSSAPTEAFFKTDNSGKTWKHVYAGGWAGHLAESNGVLVSTSKRSIIRSTDNGENWALAISEDSVVFDVKQIKGGFAAITSNSEVNTVNTSRLSASYDGGKTWQPIET